MTEGGCLQIERNRGKIRLDSFELLGYNINKAEKCVCGKAVTGGQRADSVKLTVQYTVAVNAKKFFHFFTKIFRKTEIFIYTAYILPHPELDCQQAWRNSKKVNLKYRILR
jgi:hypothetical protein